MSTQSIKETIISETGQVDYTPQWLSDIEASQLLKELSVNLDWRRDRVRVFGKTHLIPRLQSFYGDPRVQYTYSGKQLEATPWHPALFDLAERLRVEMTMPFNCVLCNLYRNGMDHMGWHSDDEKSLGDHPCIASVSLGAERSFKLRRRKSKREVIDISLEHGSLLVMSGDTQKYWDHSLPTRKRIDKQRINLTFRYVYDSEKN